jgi:chromosomal replication initiator protein
VLLVDDIQFLTGKERTQEEFFHTFNALYDSQKQIVMTSDCAPPDIPALEERLRSRFQWGLIAGIQPPDLETKIAILNKKAEAEGVALPSDVALYVASKIKSNVRELEGSLIRLIAYSSMSNRPIDVELAKEILKDLLAQEAPVITIEAIQKHVAEHYNLKVSQIKSKNNSRPIAFPRQVAMYLCKTLTDRSLPEIGRKFGGKHHTTVIHALRKIEAMKRSDKEFDKVLHNLAQALR